MTILSDWKKIQQPGIDSMETVEIGGIKQALYFRGEDVKNPIIFFIHGGPGYPEMPFLHDFQYPWEAHFTIVHWDQRNVGKTFFLNNPESVLDTLNFDRVLADAFEVTQYIREKLNQDKIIVLGYSWGTALGAALVQSHPQYFSAYIGLGQVVDIRENERVGYEALLEAALAKGNEEDIEAIRALAPHLPSGPFNESVVAQIGAVRTWQTKYGIASSGNEAKAKVLLSESPYYSPQEKEYFNINFLNYQLPLIKFLFDEYDIRKFYGVTFEMPVFIIMGDRDYQTPHTVARGFFEEISAPHKEFFLIPDAGHGAMQDNKEEFNRVLLEEIKAIICK